MISCIHCGKSNVSDSKFCRECGRRLIGDSLPEFIPVAHGETTPAMRDDQLRRLLDMAFWHNDAGNVDAAVRACRAALAIDPENISALSLIGCLAEKQGDKVTAIDAFERIVALNPASTADIEKLDRLRNGVDDPVIEPPKGFRWIPPVASRFVLSNPAAPAVAGVFAGVVVLVLGIGVLHSLVGSATSHTIDASQSAQPSAVGVSTPATTQVASAKAATTASVATAPGSVSQEVREGAYDAGDLPAEKSGMLAQSIVVSPNQPPLKIYSNGQPATGRDVFAPPTYRAPAKPNAQELPSVASVKPIPMVPTAPQDATVSIADVPQHTVVVAAPSAAPTPSQSTDNPGLPAPPAPHIEIHFYGSSASQGDVPSDSASASNAGSASHGMDLQARAIRQQDQGEYSQALETYSSAIDAYRKDLQAGRNSDYAQRGIDACQTGIQICKQSQ